MRDFSLFGIWQQQQQGQNKIESDSTNLHEVIEYNTFKLCIGSTHMLVTKTKLIFILQTKHSHLFFVSEDFYILQEMTKFISTDRK